MLILDLDLVLLTLTKVLQFEQLGVHEIQFVLRQSVINIPQLIRIDVEVVIGDDAAHELAVQVVVSRVHGSQAPVGVRVGVGARAERAVIPKWRRSPVVVVVAEAVSALVGHAARGHVGA